MAVREELEAALRRKWDRETLAVYADHLEAIGEPRGELISIDLRIDESGPTPELVAYRKELIDKWFGFQPRGCTHGFVDIDATSADPVEQLTLLDGPASAFVRSIAIVGAPKTIAAAIAKLAEAQRPWLCKLVIRQWSETGALIDTERLVAATPNLARLEIDARRCLRPISHPALTSARLSGIDAVKFFETQLVELDFAYHAHLASTHEETLPRSAHLEIFRIGLLRTLRTLDLSRNEPGYLDPYTLGGGEDIYAHLHHLAMAGALETLHLPAIRTPAQHEHLRTALPTIAALTRVTITRGDKQYEPGLVHPSAKIEFVTR